MTNIALTFQKSNVGGMPLERHPGLPSATDETLDDSLRGNPIERPSAKVIWLTDKVEVTLVMYWCRTGIAWGHHLPGKEAPSLGYCVSLLVCLYMCLVFATCRRRTIRKH